MNQEKIEYFRIKDCISGYAHLIEPKQLQKENILEFITKWSQKKKVKIFDYSLGKVEEENSGGKHHYSSERGLSQNECEKLLGNKPVGKYDIDNAMIYKISMVDWVYYLTIWYQDL